MPQYPLPILPQRPAELYPSSRNLAGPSEVATSGRDGPLMFDRVERILHKTAERDVAFNLTDRFTYSHDVPTAGQRPHVAAISEMLS
ncbi:hypothetical protein [Actinoplanes hulinensis]|uniref:hypothetical protein n=1 Tax=Actinoplanes hulinensis TaxID=1144547 RepID=UPI001C67F535|nr:hypothetical protein [Actinoplanes hulinensis]